MYRTPLTLLTTGLALVLLTAGSAVAQDEVPARSSVRGFSVSAGGSTTLFGRDGAEDVEHERRIG